MNAGPTGAAIMTSAGLMVWKPAQQPLKYSLHTTARVQVGETIA